LAKGGDYEEASNDIREYWVVLLDLGGTTFWEDFDKDWMKNAVRIDEIVLKDKVDVHTADGNYCYKGFRYSLCHGLAFGSTLWLSQYVLGVNVLKPGCREISIESHREDLQWVKGAFPTPYGVVEIEHKKQSDGIVKTKFKAPKGVKVAKL